MSNEDNVITHSFKPKRLELVLECYNCGEQRWYIQENGDIECDNCGRLSQIPFIDDSE